MLIDTHVHLDLAAFAEDRAAVIDRATAAGVTRVIIPGIDCQQTAAALRLIDAQPGWFFAAGIHPNSTAKLKDDDARWLNQITKFSQHPRCVAIGEIGLDYHWDTSPRERQHATFRAQLTLAAQLGKPVIIHNREATPDTLAILTEWVRDLPPVLRDRPGVLHSFSGDLAQMEQALALGFYLGFSGPITYKNAEITRRVAAATPLDRLLIETDAPFLPPVPYRGQRNEPAYVALVADRLAALHNCTLTDIAVITTANAERLFALPPQS